MMKFLSVLGLGLGLGLSLSLPVAKADTSKADTSKDELMIMIVLGPGDAHANIVGLKDNEDTDISVIPIKGITVDLTPSLLARLERIEAKLDALGGSSGETRNINTATYDQILSISGIGPVKAGAIITARDTPVFQPFTSWENLQQRVSGIGPSTIADMRTNNVVFE